MRRIYKTLDGRRLDLGNLTDEQWAFFERCYEGYQGGMPWADLGNLIASTENPLVRATGGWITPAVWDHPMFQAVRDLEDRVGIRQEEVAPDPGDDLDGEPLVDEELATRRRG
jgi:hypothetical protein